MFHSARLKLTGWYLCMIMSVSLLFSLAIYRAISGELLRFEHLQRLRIERDFAIPGDVVTLRPPADPDLIQEALMRLASVLGLINLGIFAAAGIIGYILAGKTLRPIQEMVEEQHRFVADASHELRTPLTSLKSMIEVNLRDKELRASDAREVLTSSLEEVNRLQTLSEDLLNLTPYEKPQEHFTLKPIESKTLVEGALHHVEPLAKKKHIQLQSEVNEFTFAGDAQALEKALVILLDNAIKYSPAKKTVSLKASHHARHTVFSVSDEGPGIEPQDIPRIFDRFWRADKSRQSKNTPGYGLGLSIAKSIVEAHKGTLVVENNDTVGCTFTITLPA